VIELIFNGINAFFQFMDLVLFNWLFCFVPGMLRVMSLMILSYTIGGILEFRKRTFWKITLYLFVFVYSLYSMGLLSNLLIGLQWGALQWTSALLGIVAPICMIIVGKLITSLRIKTHRVFNYYTWLLIYIVICTLWWFFIPEDIYYGFVWLFLAVLLVIKWIYYQKYGVVKKIE